MEKMHWGLKNLNICVLGGDDRELVLVPKLLDLGANVRIVGFPNLPQLAGAKIFNSMEAAVEGADALILPMPGTDATGNIRAIYSDEKLVLTESIVKLLKPGTPIIIGSAREFLQKWVNKYNLKLFEIAEIDEVAILNAIPTAEGAIQIVMEQSPITIHNSKSIVLGFGRVGYTMARTLKVLGSQVLVVVRKEAQMARAFELGYDVCTYEDLPQKVLEAHFIFNTVPAMIIDRNLLNSMSPEVIIIDLAAQPGGTDFQAAADLGIKAILAPGLPGKVAPRTAGEILAKVIPRFIVQGLNKDNSGGA